jgi:VanZ family protein
MGVALRRILILALTVSLPLLAFLPLKPAQNPSLWIKINDAGHFPLMALFSLLVFQVLGRGVSPGRRYVWAAAIGCGTVLLIELVQPMVSRQRSLGDLVTGLLGVTVSLTGVALWHRRTAVLARVAHAFATATIAVVLLTPIWAELSAATWRRNHFPLLADFEDKVERHLWHARGYSRDGRTTVALSAEYASSGAQSLKVSMAAGSWAGAGYWAGLTSWEGYGELRVDLYNPGDPYLLRMRVRDAGSLSGADGGFAHNVDLPSGWTTVRVDIREMRGKTRKLDPDRIDTLAFQTGRDQPARTLYIDNVRLSR